MGAAKWDLVDLFLAVLLGHLEKPGAVEAVFASLASDYNLGRPADGSPRRGRPSNGKDDVVDGIAEQAFLHLLSTGPDDRAYRLRVAASVDFAELVVRAIFGGRRAGWIRKGASPAARELAIARGLQQKLPMAEVFRRAGVSRATGYRHLRRRSSEK